MHPPVLLLISTDPQTKPLLEQALADRQATILEVERHLLGVAVRRRRDRRHRRIVDGGDVDGRRGGGDEIAARPGVAVVCLLYTSPSPRDRTRSRMPSSA